MVRGSSGRGKKSKGTHHKNKRNCTQRKSILARKARKITINNCIRRRGRLSRKRLMEGTKKIDI